MISEYESVVNFCAAIISKTGHAILEVAPILVLALESEIPISWTIRPHTRINNGNPSADNKPESPLNAEERLGQTNQIALIRIRIAENPVSDSILCCLCSIAALMAPSTSAHSSMLADFRPNQ